MMLQSKRKIYKRGLKTQEARSFVRIGTVDVFHMSQGGKRITCPECNNGTEFFRTHYGDVCWNCGNNLDDRTDVILEADD